MRERERERERETDRQRETEREKRERKVRECDIGQAVSIGSSLHCEHGLVCAFVYSSGP